MNIKDMVDKSIHYSEFANRVFNYLNGRVNTINIASGLVIKEFNSIFAVMNFAYVTMYLSSVILEHEDDNTIKMMIVNALAHELSHFDQVIDVNRYTSDYSYMVDVENQANKYACEFICNNYKEIVSQCGYFPIYYFTQTFEALRYRSNIDLKKVTVDDIFKLHLKNIFGIEEDKYNLILMDCDGKELYIKYFDHYNSDKLLEFNQCILKIEQSSMSYNIKSGKSTNNKLLKITSVDRKKLPNIASTAPYFVPVVHHKGG